MNDKITSVDLTDRIWNFFSSVKLSVVLLLTLALTSIIGTLIPQNKQEAQYLQQYGEFWHGIFSTLNFYDMYSSWWFQLLLALLIVNIVVCSIERLSHTWRVIFPKKVVYRTERFRKSDSRQSHTTDQTPDALKGPLADYMAKHFRHSRVEPTENGYLVYGEKGRWTRLGAHIIHLSVLLLILGVLISSLFGYEGRMNLPVGETDNTMTLRHSDARVQLDFALRCDDFSIEHYPSGRVREYRSEIAIIEPGDSASPPASQNDACCDEHQGEPASNLKGEVVDKRSLIVNDPIRYRGYSIFQSTYGRLPGDTFTLVFTDNASGLQTSKKASINDEVRLPGNKGSVIVQDYTNNFSFRGQNIGPSYLAVVIPETGNPRPVILPLEHPNFDRMRQGEFTIRVDNVDYRYFTGLQISRDPGIPVVYTSFGIMILGFLVTFYMAHRQICIEALRTDEGATTIRISGISPNRRPGVNMAVKRVSAKIEDIIEKNKIS